MIRKVGKKRHTFYNIYILYLNYNDRTIHIIKMNTENCNSIKNKRIGTNKNLHTNYKISSFSQLVHIVGPTIANNLIYNYWSSIIIYLSFVATNLVEWKPHPSHK